MATDKRITELPSDAAPSLDDLLAVVNDPAGTPATRSATIAAVQAADGLTGLLKATGGVRAVATPNTDVLAPAAWTVCGRLTTETAVPVSTSDRTAQATVYWTPYNGDSVPLYTGSAWIRLAFTEISLALSGLTSGKNYDVFVYNNSGTLALELSAAWASDTTRADALALQNGLSVKSGTTTRLHVGTIRTTGTTTTEDSAAKRFVWNRFNQVPRRMLAIDTTDSWVYTTATLRQANAAAANQLDYVVGDAAAEVQATVYVTSLTSNAASYQVNIGVDSTTVGSALLAGTNGAGAQYSNISALYAGAPGLGRHVLVWLEQGGGVGTTTWFGDHGGGLGQSGITGRIWN